MKQIIKKGKHRAFRLPKLWIGKTILRRSVVFLPSCKYDLNSNDQEDTNKLFGIGYLLNHHIDSARFGWRYDNAIGKFIISAYCYVAGQRIIKEICKCNVNQRYIFELDINPGFYEFSVKPENEIYVAINEFVEKTHTKMISYQLGFYFGGDRTAPHDMTIEIKKL